MPLLNVPGTRSGDSLPAELRSGVSQFCGTPLLPSLRLSASGAGLSGMSIWYGATEGAPGYRAYDWPLYGYRGMSGLGQACDFFDSMGNCLDANGNPTGATINVDSSGNPIDLSNLPTLPSNAPIAVQYPTQGQTQSTPVLIGNTQIQAQHPPAYTGPVSCAAGQNCGTAPSGYQWVPVVNQAGNTLAQVLAVAQHGGYTIGPGGVTVTGSPGMPTTGAQTPTFSAGLFTNPTSMVLILGAGLLLVMMMQQQSKK